MRLLFVSSFHLFPGTRFGGTKRLYYFAREWERTVRLTLISMDACGERGAAAASPSDPGFRDSLFVPGAGVSGPWDRLTRAPADRRGALAPRLASIRDFLRGKSFDAVLLAFPWSLSLLGTAIPTGGCPVTYMEDDLVLEQFRKGASGGPPLKRLLQGFRLAQTRAYYRDRMARVDRFVGISEPEAEVMGAMFPRLPRSVVKYALPLEEYPPLPPPEDARTVGFIGNYAHGPNLDALRWISEAVAPAVRRLRPDARVLVAGRGVPAWFRERHGADPSVEVREEVADLAFFYSDVAVFLNPVREGRGLRTKVLEAAAYGRPVVSTALGAEGLEDLRLSVADDAEGLAAACASMLARWPAEEVAANRRTVEERYSIRAQAADFLERLAAPRAGA